MKRIKYKENVGKKIYFMSEDNSNNSPFKFFQETVSSIILTDDCNVPSELRFNKVRQMPITKQPYENSYYMFPSIQSYNAFKNNQMDFCLNKEGVGIPLFKFEVCWHMEHNPYNPSELIRYKVFHYVLKSTAEPPPFSYESIVKSNDTFSVYKCLFCTISKRVKWFSDVYRMAIQETPERPYHIISKYSKLDVLMDDYIIRWQDTYNIFRDTGFKAQILPIETKSLFDSAREFKTFTPYYNQALIKKKHSDKEKNFNEPRVYPFDTYGTKQLKEKPLEHFIGRYTTEGAGGFSSKVAIAYIGEYGSLNSFGIINIPFETKLLACQALLLNRIEIERQSRRRRRRRNSVNWMLM